MEDVVRDINGLGDLYLDGDLTVVEGAGCWDDET